MSYCKDYNFRAWERDDGTVRMTWATEGSGCDYTEEFPDRETATAYVVKLKGYEPRWLKLDEFGRLL